MNLHVISSIEKISMNQTSNAHGLILKKIVLDIVKIKTKNLPL